MKSSHDSRHRSIKHAPQGVDDPRFAALRRRLGRNVARLRTDLGLTQTDASERAELGWRHWQKIEAGQANAQLSTLAQLAAALEVDPVELLQPAKASRKGGAR